MVDRRVSNVHDGTLNYNGRFHTQKYFEHCIIGVITNFYTVEITWLKIRYNRDWHTVVFSGTNPVEFELSGWMVFRQWHL